MSKLLRLFFILNIALIAFSNAAVHLYDEKEAEDDDDTLLIQPKIPGRIYYTSTSLITRLFQTLNAFVALYPDRDEHVLQYLAMLQKEIQKRRDNGALSGEMLVYMMEGFENWLAHYMQTYSGEKNKPLLADIIHITDCTMRVVREQMIREKKLVDYQLDIIQGIEVVYKTIDSSKAFIQTYPYKDEHLSICLRLLEEELRAKIAEKTLTALVLVQMIESFHKWLLYYASTRTDSNSHDLLQTLIGDWTRMCNYVMSRVGDQTGQYTQPSSNKFYRIAAISAFAGTLFWLARLSFEKRDFVKSFFSTMSLDDELDNQAKKHHNLDQEAADIEQQLIELQLELAPYKTVFEVENGKNTINTKKVATLAACFRKFADKQISLIEARLHSITSLHGEFHNKVKAYTGLTKECENKLKKLESILSYMQETWIKIEEIIKKINGNMNIEPILEVENEGNDGGQTED